VIAITCFVATTILVLASLGKAGVVGEKVFAGFKYMLGLGYFLLPLIFAMLGIASIMSVTKKFPLVKIISALTFLLSGLGIIDIFFPIQGGMLGRLVSNPAIKLFDKEASVIILGAIFVISVIVIFESGIAIDSFFNWFRELFSKRQAKKDKDDMYEAVSAVARLQEQESEDQREVDNASYEQKEKERLDRKKPKIEPKITEDEGGMDFDKKTAPSFLKNLGKVFNPPPLSLLEKDKGKAVVGDINANKNIIKRTLQNFGIDVEMDEISIGPSVTRYALKPAEGVKLSKIVALQNDLSLALAAHPLRIEAPIPGKSLVGIEIPNSTKSTVGLATLLANEEYQKSEKPLLISLGKGISGKSYFSNLAKMPHLLIAGTTGSGKSVTIHTIITSLLFRNPVENLKFIMIDPKRVELTLYNKIPHLLTPVITEAKKAILALKWAAKEMDRRYDILESESVRDIESYHKNVLAPELKRLEERKGDEGEEVKIPELMPYIVVVIDELADIMSTYPRELEAAIVRLAQMSRAVGIHLILSTQRPSVNVITGLIKANIPGRIALQVSSQIDSRTILDTGGAEKLLGAGDMLFLGSEMSKPQRIQSAYISETELKKVVNYLKENYDGGVPTELNLTPEAVAGKNAIFESSFGDEDGGSEEDDMYEQAKEEVLKAGKASTSYLQRKLRIGYSRAARLVDMLQEKGVIGAADGARPREVIGAESTENPAPDENPENVA
jgi:S-DNA-T family DNA segregation ATPase FtsK/SpoIIIE